MISYAGLARSGSNAQFRQYMPMAPVAAPAAAPAAKNPTGSRGYSDRSNCYKALAQHCTRNNTQSSFYRVILIVERWFWVQR